MQALSEPQLECHCDLLLSPVAEQLELVMFSLDPILLYPVSVPLVALAGLVKLMNLEHAVVVLEEQEQLVLDLEQQVEEQQVVVQLVVEQLVVEQLVEVQQEELFVLGEQEIDLLLHQGQHRFQEQQLRHQHLHLQEHDKLVCD